MSNKADAMRTNSEKPSDAASCGFRSFGRRRVGAKSLLGALVTVESSELERPEQFAYTPTASLSKLVS